MTNQCIHPDCTDLRAPGALVCTRPGNSIDGDLSDEQPLRTSALTDPFDEFATNPFGTKRPDPTPSEIQEAGARDMRAMYLALRGQNFTADEALTLVGETVGAIFREQARMSREDQGGDQ
jgi:hypothetical protein